MPRVVGCDPGTSRLDLLRLDDGVVVGQSRLPPDAEDSALLATLAGWAPLDLIAGPSGYGVPLVPAAAITPRDLTEMTLVRPDDREHEGGVRGFKAHVRALIASGFPTVFLPGGVHLPTIPPHRKFNAIDLGTPDKLSVAALALHQHAAANGGRLDRSTFALVEIGSAFSAVLVVDRGKLVDAAAGSRGPLGLRSAGAWDGEAAYAFSPLSKSDLFRGGLRDLGPEGANALRESLTKHLAGLKAVTPFETLYLSGRGLDDPAVAAIVHDAAAPFGTLHRLENLPGAQVKHAAQGAALLADGLMGGRHVGLVDSLELRRASGTIGDWLRIRPEGTPTWMGQ